MDPTDDHIIISIHYPPRLSMLISEVHPSKNSSHVKVKRTSHGKNVGVFKYRYLGVSKIGIPQNGWFRMENSIKMDDLGVPLFSETPICFQKS